MQARESEIMKNKREMLNGLCPGLSVEKIRHLACETKFVERCHRKISPEDFVNHLCVESINGTVSHNDLAAKIAVEEGHAASRQAYSDRMDDDCVLFFQRILEEVMKTKCETKELEGTGVSGAYKRILIQDSTVIRLPQRLFGIFSGVKNADASVCNARIQGVYDLLQGSFVYFSIDPYSKNDLAAISDFPLQKGDLMLRDRGYFTLDAFSKAIGSEADLVSRYRYKTTFADPETGENIDLLGMLRGKGKVDMHVLAGEKEKVPVRLMAVPVCEETANIRRMKAKKESKGPSPSREILELMSWTIFITTIKSPAFTFKVIFILYSLRWRIETIFKTWKSHLQFNKIHNVSEEQLTVLLYARFIMICVVFVHGYDKFKSLVFSRTKRDLSLLKFIRLVTRNISDFLENCLSARNEMKFVNIIGKYCVYERRKRENFNQQYRSITLIIRNICELT
jgi:hypothetical protein